MIETDLSSHKVALIFGGSRGIGAATAARLAGEGFRVALTYASSPGKAAEVVAAIEANGGEAVAIKADSSDAVAIRSAVSETVEHYGPLSVVVVNAGILRLGTVDAFDVHDLDRVLAINVRGVFLAIQAAAAQMRYGGRIVTIGSNAAIRPVAAGSSVYAMSKAAVSMMVKGIALDLAPRGITVNNIQPGPIETDMTATMVPKLRAMIPIGRLGQSADVAALVAYLAGADSGYMTGASLTIDGGFIL